MGLFSSIGKAVKSVGKAVGKAAGSAVKAVGKVGGTVIKTAGNVAGSVVSKIPVVGTVYDVATGLIGVDPIKAVTGTVGSVIGGGNIGDNIASSLKDSLTGGLIGAFTSSKKKDESLPEFSNEEPGIYAYEDGSYAYTVLPDGKVVHDPEGKQSQQLVVEEANGSISPIPDGLAAKQMYIKQILDSYGNPLGVDKAAYTMSAINNFTLTGGQLDGAEASNILALDVVNKEPEALAYTASALQQTTGTPSVDWVKIITGLWNTAKDVGIPSVSGKLEEIEDKVYGAAKDVVTNTGKKAFSDWLYDNWMYVTGGVLAVVVLLVVVKRN